MYYACVDGGEDLLNLALLHYCEEHSVLTRPHGNARSDTGFIQTMPSSLSKVCELSENLKRQHVVSKLPECWRDSWCILQATVS